MSVTIGRMLLPVHLRGISRKRNVRIEAYPNEGWVEMHDLDWSGGTRGEYRHLPLRDGDKREYGRVRERDAMAFAPHNAILQTGYFCGKVSTAVLHVRRSDMHYLFPSAMSADTPPEILADWLDDCGRTAQADALRQLLRNLDQRGALCREKAQGTSPVLREV